MGNSQNKLEKRSASPPPKKHVQNHAGPSVDELSMLRQIAHAAKRKQHDIVLTANNDGYPVPFMDALFLPEYPLKEDVEGEFEVVEVIAKGAFGNVLKVQRHGDNTAFAMKVMKKSQVIVDGAVQQCKDEATVQNTVGHHPFIVKPHSFFQNKENIYIVMEYIPRGELFAAWKHCDNFSETLVKLYIAELAMVLDYLHRAGIIYRDLKMENILIDSEGHLQVIDFGLAKWLRRGQRTRTICGTLQYIAPEVLNMMPYGHSADWWSLGILMYALLVGEYPVSGTKNHFEMAKKVKCHRYELPRDSDFSWEAQQCVKKLLCPDPIQRMHDLGSVQREPFFEGLNFESLAQRLLNPAVYLESQEVVFGFGNREAPLSLYQSTCSVDGGLDSHKYYKDYPSTFSVDEIGLDSRHDFRNFNIAWNDSIASQEASFV